jgi:hypothetical protein
MVHRQTSPLRRCQVYRSFSVCSVVSVVQIAVLLREMALANARASCMMRPVVARSMGRRICTC